MTPNLGKPLRVVYVAFGAVLLLLALLMALHPWMRIGAAVLGVLSIIGGATGK